MLTAVWFILVAIAIPCQAYLDDRVLLDQHWTGFSPTTGVGARGGDEARSYGSARSRDHEPDKRSVGFSLLREDKPQMARGVRAATRRSQDSTYLRFRREGARDSGVAERSVRRVLVSLERLSRRESIEGLTRSVGSAALFESRASDLRGEEREYNDQSTRLDARNEARSERYSRQRMADDTPIWVREDSRRRVRSANRDLVRSDDRRTSDRVRRYESEERDSRGRQATDAPSLTRLSRSAETRMQNPEDEIDLIRATRSDTFRSGPSRLQMNGNVNRDRRLQDDATNQGDIITRHRSNQIGLAQGPSFSTRTTELRVKNSAHRHADERKSDATALLQTTSRREVTLARQPGQDSLRRSHSVSSSNSREGDNVGNQVRHTVHTERSIRDFPVSLKDENSDTRRFSASRRYVQSAVRSDDTEATRSFFGRSNRHERSHDSYSFSLRHLQDEPKETAQDRRDYRRFSSMIDEVQSGNIPTRRSYYGSSRIEEARFFDATRRTRIVRTFDWEYKEGNPVQVTTRSQVRSHDTRRNSMAASRRSQDSCVFTRAVEYPVEIVRYSNSRLVRGDSFARQDRMLEDYGQQLILPARHSENRLRNNGDRRNPLSHIDNSHSVTAADSRHREGRRLSLVERHGTPNFYRNFRFEETRRSVRMQMSRTMITDDVATVTTRSMGNSKNDAARNSFRLIREDTQILLNRLERYPMKFSEKQQDSSNKALNDRRDLRNMQFFKTELSSSFRDSLEKILPEEGSDKYKEKLSRYAKHHQEDLSWDKVMTRSGSSLLQTILTVGIVAWMTASPPKKLVD